MRHATARCIDVSGHVHRYVHRHMHGYVQRYVQRHVHRHVNGNVYIQAHPKRPLLMLLGAAASNG